MPSGIIIKCAGIPLEENEKPYAPLVLNFGDGANYNHETGEVDLCSVTSETPVPGTPPTGGVELGVVEISVDRTKVILHFLGPSGEEKVAWINFTGIGE